MKPFPRITIVTPSYNQGRYIEETVSSVLDQDYGNFEYIVMDGGSTDDTVAVLERYSDRIDYWISAEDAGQSDAIERGFARATGDILAWVNSDDCLAPEALSAVADAFMNSDADLVAGVVAVREHDRLVYRHRTGCSSGPLRLEELLDLENSWMAGRFFYQPEVFFSRDIYQRAGGRLDRDLHYSMDYDLWLRCAQVGAKILPIDRELARFRTHPAQKTSSVDAFVPELTRHANSVRRRLGLAPVDMPGEKPARRPARIGMVNDFGFRYGAGRAHRRMAECLAAAQYEVSFFAFRDDVSDDRSCVFSSAVEALRGAEVDVIIVGNLHGAFPEGVDLSSLAEVAPILLVTHDFFAFTGRCPYPLGCDGYLLTCPLTCPTRDQYPVIPFDHIPSAHSRKLANLANDRVTVLANSRYMERSAHKLLAVKQGGSTTGHRVRYVPLSIPEAAFRPRDRLKVRARFGLADDTVMVLTVSSAVMDRRKGFLHVVEACRLAAVPNLRLFALGWVDPYHQLDGITYLGHIDDDDELACCFAAADVFVSAPADETFGQVFVEAAMCGCPSIAYDVGGVGEVVSSGRTGWLVERNDIAGVADRLRELAAQDRVARRAMRDKAHLDATSRWGAAGFLAAANDVFRSIITDPSVSIPAGVQFGGVRARPMHQIQDYRVRPARGFAVPEGPFPEHGIEQRFQWIVEGEATLDLHAPRAGQALLTLLMANVHLAKHVTLKAGDTTVAVFDLAAAPWSIAHEVIVVLEVPQGTSSLTLVAPGAMQTPDRDLYLALFSATLAPSDDTPRPRQVVRQLRHGVLADEEASPADVLANPQDDLVMPGILDLVGFRAVEGPYPEAGIAIRLAWLIEPEGRMTLAAVPSGAETLVLSIKLPVMQTLTVRMGGSDHLFEDLEPADWNEPTQLAVQLCPDPGLYRDIVLVCENGLADAAGDMLRLALLGVEFIGPEPMSHLGRGSPA